MAEQIYKVRDPTGNIREIKGPVGASDEEVIAQAQKLFASAPVPRDAAPPMSRSIGEELSGRLDWEKNLAGVGGAVNSAAMRLKQLFGGELTPQEIADIRAYDEMSKQSGHVAAGGILGSLAMTAAPGAALYRAGTSLARRVLPEMLAPTLAPTTGAATTGAAISGVTSPVLPEEQTQTKLAEGAIGGVVGDTLARGASRVIQPIIQSQPVQRLLREGVMPTPGQAAGATSFIGRIEQRLQSIPIIGDVITAGRDRATNEFNVAAITRALPRDAQGQITRAGRDSIAAADNIISDGYADVLSRIPRVVPTPQFVQRLVNVLADPDLALSTESQRRILQIVNQQIVQRLQNGEMTGQLAKRADANIGMLTRNFASSNDMDQRMMSRGLREVQNVWRSEISSNAGPAERQALEELNRAFANFVRVERAAGAIGTREGVFTPAQLQRAVRGSDPSARHNAFARGDALMQDLSEAGISTLSQTVPNSGTIDRGLLAVLLGAGLGGSAEASHRYFGTPQYLTALAAAPLLYSRTGSRYMIGGIPGQTTLADLLRQTAPYATQAGALYNTK